ncbi:Crp/Fnr family transcriptional regulator [Sphaerisporangium krabiense]|uniref:CRP-like cAMP-binding protein n=1 Tax=Sphaerisporangium krabiense TaxID=763782 RepID=A0A7W8Z2H2_9ACTN|nr:Crp/Fnr family transcriptional regulator [Sphaerisporangium krabiense]MBB5626232.1 CRP-like cAMP-binding protein [Sphaerisporangium krabiense]GII66102.1 Crp/Fnr family transcriptional regulator [Sphaerisporangium krabiense]
MRRRPGWPSETFLARLPEASRQELLGLGPVHAHPAGRVLVRQGDPGTLLYVIAHGLVKVTARTENGKESLLAVRVRGDLVGDMALGGSPRSATVTTCGPTTTCVIKGDVFLAFICRHPPAALAWNTFTGERLRWANQRRLEFAGYDSDVCLARLLLALLARHGRPTRHGMDLGVPLTQPELGSLIGAKESTVQKILRDLSVRGLVRTGRRRVVVTDVPGLTAFAELPPSSAENHRAKP